MAGDDAGEVVPPKPARKRSWRLELEDVLWEKLRAAPPRDSAPIARALMELKGAASGAKGAAKGKPVKSALSEFEKRRAARKSG